MQPPYLELESEQAHPDCNEQLGRCSLDDIWIASRVGPGNFSWYLPTKISITSTVGSAILKITIVPALPCWAQAAKRKAFTTTALRAAGGRSQ